MRLIRIRPGPSLALFAIAVLAIACSPNRRRTASRMDGGASITDSGSDGFAPFADTAPPVDGGSGMGDAGPPAVDGGPVGFDAGIPVLDAGIPLFDGGIPSLDAGFAICTSDLDCTDGRCCPLFPGLPVMVCLPGTACPDAGLGF